MTCTFCWSNTRSSSSHSFSTAHMKNNEAETSNVSAASICSAISLLVIDSVGVDADRVPPLISAAFEDISHSADRVNQFFIEPDIHLVTEPPYRDIDNVRIAVKIQVPNLFCDMGPRQNFTLP